MDVEGLESEPSLLGVRSEPDKEKVENKVKKSRKRKKKDNDETKTRPPNPFGQFLKHKRAMDGKVDFQKACAEWKQMTSAEKGFYIHCFEEEKAAMGDKYRPTNSKEEKHKNGKEVKKKSKTAKVKQLKEESFSSHQLLSKVEAIDSEINKLHSKSRQLQETLHCEKVQLALSQFKLEEKTQECSNVQEKYQVLLTQHSSCLDVGLFKK